MNMHEKIADERRNYLRKQLSEMRGWCAEMSSRNLLNTDNVMIELQDKVNGIQLNLNKIDENYV
jgi:hypothetical protein